MLEIVAGVRDFFRFSPAQADHLSAIRIAIGMDLQERKRRWQAMFDNVQRYDVGWWRRRFTDALMEAC